MPKKSQVAGNICAKFAMRNEKFAMRNEMVDKRHKLPVYAGLTILEMIIALTIITIILSAILPQFRVIQNSWDSKAGIAEAMQNGRVLADHLNRNLAKAVRITAVSNSSETTGYIQFEDNDGNTLRYDVNSTTNYVEFGVVGNLSDLAGPVSKLQFTCYDACDLDTPIADLNDVNSIRFVKAETILTNSAALGQDKTFTASAYLRANSDSSAADCNLVGHWKLDETSGTTVEDSSGSNDGTLTNMVGDEWTTGTVGGALQFDGSEDYVDCGSDESLNITGAVTVTAWIKLTATGIDQKVAGNQDDSAGGYKMTVYSNNKVEFEIRDSSNNPTFNRNESGGTVLTTGVWYHVAGVYSQGNYIRTYVNGNLDRPMSTASVLGSTSGTLKIGREPFSSSDFFDGLIDDVRIYDRALDANEISDLANVVITYQEFTEAKAGSNVNSLTISTPDGGGGGVGIRGLWTSGLSHTEEAGSNRMLILTAHVEDDDADMDLLSVTYGGQSMTKVIERETQESSQRDYVVAYILNEAGIDAASGDTFSLSWSSTPDKVRYSSVFLANVNQTTPTGASDSNGSNTADTISTSALSTNNGDMVIVAGTAGDTGTYSVNNGFIEAIELPMTSAAGIAGYKLADGTNETPSITHNKPWRQVIIGFVVQVNQFEEISIEGDLLIAAVVTDGSETISPPAGEGWTEIDHGAYGSNMTLGVWWKLADSGESPSHQFTWGSSEQAYGWIMRFTGHDPTNPINTSAGQGGDSTTPDCPSVTTTVANTMIVRIGGFDDDDITIDNPGLSGHSAITMDESNSGSNTCSGGAGYKQQATIGSSGTVTFDLTNKEEYRTVTIAIAPQTLSSDLDCSSGVQILP